jgi:hypothetical protein
MKSIQQQDILIALALATFFTAFSVIASLHQGKLSAPPTYDDILYFEDAARRLQIFYDNDFLVFLHSFIIYPPHAPLSTLAGIIGFALFGMHPWAVPLVNGFWIFLLLLGLRIFFSNYPILVYLAVATSLLAWPLTAYLLMLAQADAVCGFFIAFGCLYVLSIRWNEISRSQALMSGAAAGLALVIKPSISPVTAVLFGWAALLTSALSYTREPNKQGVTKSLIRANLYFVSFVILFASPYYAFGLKDTFDYFFQNVFGDRGPIWTLKLTPVQHAIYYLWGGGGQMTMGPWFFVSVLALLVASILQFRWIIENRWRVNAVVAWCFVAYLSVTIPSTKSIFLGIVVSCVFFILYIVALRGIFSKIAEVQIQNVQFGFALNCLICTVLVIIAASTFHWHIYYKDSGSHTESAGNHNEIESSTLSSNRYALMDKIVAGVIHPNQISLIYIPAITGYINPSSIAFALAERRIRNIEVLGRENIFDDKLENHRAAIASASDVILLDPDDPELSQLPSTRVLRSVQQELSTNANFVLREQLDTADGRHLVSLYQRRPPFDGVRLVMGFMAPEGPYPQWNLDYVRWAVGSEARVEPSSDKFSELYLKAQSPIANQAMVVEVDGHKIGDCHFAEPWTATECKFAIPEDLRSKPMALKFLLLDAPNREGRALLFQELKVR